MRVLITGGRAPVALDLARQLALAGSEVFVADSAPCFLAGASRSVTRSYRIPPPRQKPHAFADAVAAIVEREGIDLILPTCEEVFYLARFATQLSARAELFCAGFDTLQRLHDKWRFVQFATSLGLGVPQTWLLQTTRDVEDLAAQSQDLVCKPVFSRFAVHTLVRPTQSQFARLRPSVNRPWIAQRFVSGKELCTYSVARCGVLTAHAAYRPTWRAGRVGSSYYFDPVDHPGIERIVATIVASLDYTGQIAFDFIETQDGCVNVLECNPRATSGVHLFDRNDGLAAAFERTAPGTARPSSGTPAMLAPAMVVLGPFAALRSRRVRQLATDFSVARDAVWSRSDPLPAFYLYVGLGAFVFAGLREGVSPTTASTRDIEWDGEAIR